MRGSRPRELHTFNCIWFLILFIIYPIFSLYSTKLINAEQTTRKNFYRGAEGVILVFDLTGQKSFDNLNNWYQDVKKTLNIHQNFIGFIIGNKNDLINERKVKREDAEILANKLNLRYIETSALTGKNIMFIFHKIGEILLSNFLNNPT